MKDKILKGSILLIAVISIIVATFHIIKNEVQATDTTAGASTTSGSAGVTTGVKRVSGETDPSTYAYKTHTGTWEAVEGYNSSGIPYHKGFDIYCINPGSPIRYGYQIRYAEKYTYDGKELPPAKDIVDKTYTGIPHAKTPTPNKACDPTVTPYVTPPVFSEAGTFSLPAAAAFIVSSSKGWTLDKQRGIWNLRDEQIYDEEDGKYEDADDNLIIGGADSHTSGPSTLDQPALDYAQYESTVKDKGLEPKNNTDITKLNTYANIDDGEYIVGPFNITYTNGIYGANAFAGISDMQVIGCNKDGKIIKDNIKVERFIFTDPTTGVDDPKGVTPRYFTPDAKTKIDDGTKQAYPKPGQDFKIVIKDPNVGVLAGNTEKRIEYVTIKVKFKHMLASGQYTKLKGVKYTVNYTTTHGAECTAIGRLDSWQQQWLMAADAIRTLYEEELTLFAKMPDGPNEPTNPPIIIIIVTPKLKMDLGGHVWEDTLATKESKADGVSNTSGEGVDKPLKNVKVTLYTEDGKIAKLLSDPSEGNVMSRINPTYTDENGDYFFKGLDPMKRYYVTFEYNGLTYLPTEYMNTASGKHASVEDAVNAGLYNTTDWEITSKGTEKTADREKFDKKFAEIRSYPENYATSNSLGKTGKYNATFTQKDLMGYTLSDSGTYQKTGTQLVDGYLYDDKGLETDTFSEGVISQKVREYIKSNLKFPDDNAMKTIYSGIAGSDKEVWQKLQFIEDCKIQSYTQGQGASSLDLYPVYESYFRVNKDINGNEYETVEEARQGTYDTTPVTIEGKEYKPIYPGQFYVNQGLWRRQEYDASIRKDVYRAAMKINDKTVVYKYDKRAEQDDAGTNNANGNDNDTYWDINVRMSDYNTYYGEDYNREIYKSDYDYKTSLAGNHPGKPLEMFVTYKITVRNQSMSTLTQIKEIVDYYDKDYKYRDDLSWIMFRDGSNGMTVKDSDYYNMIVAEKTDGIANKKPVKSATTSKYGASTHSDITSKYNAVYIQGLEDKKLASGETACIYLTFQVNRDSSGKIIVDDENSPKMNYVEINGYTTFYKDGTQLPNGVTKGSGDVAGLLDRDSNPGNLVSKDITGSGKVEKNFEDDTDRAKGLRVKVDESAVRKANGTVWEDKRTQNAGDSKIGDGIRQDDEVKIAGVKVQLVEKTTNGKEYVWYQATTDSNGHYEFANYIPGDYVIRFYYGNDSDTVKIKANGGLNDVSYNGQDFKSTIYQAGVSQSDITNTYEQNASKQYKGYKDVNSQNESGTYGYDIFKMDSNGQNVSDAKDLWTTSQILERIYNGTGIEQKNIQGRLAVNSYSDKNVTNHKAEVLASPYTNNQSLIDELITNTYMTAETGVMDIEIEYDRILTDGDKTTSNGASKYLYSNDFNGNFTINNVDFGLQERPKAQLEINKSVSNVKLTLANGTILFDANQTADNLIWKKHKEYNLEKYQKDGKYEDYYGADGKHRYSYRDEKINSLVSKNDNGLIQLTMDEELMHGATIEITYKLNVKNVGEVDYDSTEYYYIGSASGNIVTTTANQVVDYVSNNLQFDSNHAANSGWQVIQKDALNTIVNNDIKDSIAKFNNIIETSGLNTALKPGESTEKTLMLSQLITTENTDDDLTYNNIVEIMDTTNSVGRRMAYSIVGNQDPTAKQADEVDSSVAEKVMILPPYGEFHIYYALGIVIALILAGGIIFIIRKVLKK